MKSKKLLLTAIAIISSTLFFTQLYAQDKTAQDDAKETAKKTEIQQKITTPPLQLTEEEDHRTSKESAATTAPKTVTPGTPSEEKFAPILVKTKSRIELILDASGSMNGLMENSTKLDILKPVVSDVISQPLPEGADREIGLRVYGSQKASELNDCKDTQLLMPIGPVTAGTFKSKIDAITALGVTPIEATLQEAANDFFTTPNVDNVIVLVADGADSCGGTLCELGKSLHEGPQKIIVHVIGFDVDQKAATTLECLAKSADGQFIQARSGNELRTALDQLLMANLPYNLRIKVVSGATPLPATLTVYKSGTKNVVREDKTTGIKYYQLQPGTYDIEVTYDGSKETPAPSKLIKGVEVQSTSKAEHTAQFDLGLLILSAIDQTGAPAPAKYVLTKKEDPNVQAKFESASEPYNVWLTDGTYNVQVQSTNKEGLSFNANANNVRISKGGSVTQEFKFQVGQLKILGKNAKGDPVATKYKVTLAGDTAKIVSEGDAEAEGRTIDLPPGKYDLYLALSVDNLKDLPAIKTEAIEIAGGDIIEKTVEIPTATLTLSGKDADGKPVTTKFLIKKTDSKEKEIELEASNTTLSITLPPADYNVKAIYINSNVSPDPVISWERIALLKGQTVQKDAIFKFGTIKFFGRNAKGTPIPTTFYVYRVGSEEAVASFVGVTGWMSTSLTEGFYDVKAEDASARSEPKPSTWFHDVEVKGPAIPTVEAVFTHGKLRMTCRGPNNINLDCDYRVYTYGTDRPLFEGTTDENWKNFDIPPGNYYIEAGYHDAKDEVLLKKWVTISVKENEMLEQIIRF